MDEADEAELRYQKMLDAKISDVQHQLGKMKPGVPGDCDKCGEEMPRLIEGVCCRCRDKYKLR